MKTNAAVLWGIDEDWSVEEVELDGPKEGEVLISFEATGLCHSDHHVRTGDLAGVPLPIIGGHEGAGIVQEVGPGVRDLKAGDHVVTSFLPACGRCRWCATRFGAYRRVRHLASTPDTRRPRRPPERSVIVAEARLMTYARACTRTPHTRGTQRPAESDWRPR